MYADREKARLFILGENKQKSGMTEVMPLF